MSNNIFCTNCGRSLLLRQKYQRDDRLLCSICEAKLEVDVEMHEDIEFDEEVHEVDYESEY